MSRFRAIAELFNKQYILVNIRALHGPMAFSETSTHP
jgi:hypothetical protein